jgi:NADPH-dependent F420 reductase
MQITIIGAGNMGGGIATRALAGGHSVRLTDRDPAKAKALAEELRQRVPEADVADSGPSAADRADIVVLALPFPAGKEVTASYGELLAGKIVVDICNPVDFSTFDSLVVPPGTSAAEQIAAAAPGARVVKAFNTTFAGNLVAGQGGGAPLDVFIAGDDAEAKQAVADLAASGGLRPIDAGPLRRARELEGFQFLHMTLQQTLGTGWSSAIKILG